MEKIADRMWVKANDNPTVDWIVFGTGALFLGLALIATLLA